MTTKHIILSPWEMRALLDGRLKQVRRPVKEQWGNWTFATILLDGRAVFDESNGYAVHHVNIPYAVGDIVAVKETYAIYQTIARDHLNDGEIAYKADGFDTIRDLINHIKFISKGECNNVYVNDNRWRSPVTMPQWAVRKWLTVTGVRCERTKDSQLMKVGGEKIAESCGITPIKGMLFPYVHAYVMQWNADNPRYPWEDNVWQWVYEVEGNNGNN